MYLSQNIPGDVITNLIIDFFNKHIWGQIQTMTPNMTRSSAFMYFVVSFLKEKVNNWNDEAWHIKGSNITKTHPEFQ